MGINFADFGLIGEVLVVLFGVGIPLILVATVAYRAIRMTDTHRRINNEDSSNER